jgi:ubiquinone/menaquinone biosynthesis C-methylase UbiE
MADDELVFGDYLLGVLGLATMRRIAREPSAAVARRNEMETVVKEKDAMPYALRLPFSVHDVEPGYTMWAPSYDSPGNLVVATEEPIIRSLLADAPRGRALDAACGTGRHAAHLVELGYDVIGVDTTAAMLAVAREKVPAATFHQGRLEALPVEDESVDVVTCALALEHVNDLAPVAREFARVLRPGGWLITSDTHPIMREFGVGAFIPQEDGLAALELVRGRVQHVHEYLDAYTAAGLAFRRCIEPRVDETTIPTFPSVHVFPEATRVALLGLPYLLILHMQKP